MFFEGGIAIEGQIVWVTACLVQVSVVGVLQVCHDLLSLVVGIVTGILPVCVVIHPWVFVLVVVGVVVGLSSLVAGLSSVVVSGSLVVGLRSVLVSGRC